MLHSVGRRKGLRGAELDELEQDVRVRLWRSLEEGERIERASSSYVYRAAMSAAVDLIRRRRDRLEDPIEADDEPGTPVHPIARGRPDTEFEQRELGESIDRAVNELAEPRDVIVRLYLSGYDRSEIADMFGWTEPKVRNLLYRGLADLRTALAHEEMGRRRAV